MGSHRLVAGRGRVGVAVAGFREEGLLELAVISGPYEVRFALVEPRVANGSAGNGYRGVSQWAKYGRQFVRIADRLN